MKFLAERRFIKFRATEPNEENLDNSAKLAQESKKDNMINGSEIIVESKEGKLELIFNESILLLTKDDKLSIKLPEKGNNWLIKFYFTDDDKSESLTCNSNVDDDGILELSFNRWYNTTWVENIVPFNFISNDKKVEIFVKVRISAEKLNDMRHVIVSVWLKNK